MSEQQPRTVEVVDAELSELSRQAYTLHIELGHLKAAEVIAETCPEFNELFTANGDKIALFAFVMGFHPSDRIQAFGALGIPLLPLILSEFQRIGDELKPEWVRDMMTALLRGKVRIEDEFAARLDIQHFVDAGWICLLDVINDIPFDHLESEALGNYFHVLILRHLELDETDAELTAQSQRDHSDTSGIPPFLRRLFESL